MIKPETINCVFLLYDERKDQSDGLEKAKITMNFKLIEIFTMWRGRE